MACKSCNSPSPSESSVDPENLALIPGSCDEFPQVQDECAQEEIVTTTEGGDASQFTDAVEANEMTLLGRISKKIAKFVGSGFLQLENGVARVVPWIPLKVTRLYHTYTIPSPGQNPVLGDALPADHIVIADSKGQAYAVKGLVGEDSIQVWDFELEKWVVKAITDFPLSTKGVFKKSDCVELIGMKPPSKDCYHAAREAMALKGDGVVYITNTQADYPDSACCEGECDECNCDAHKTHSIARVTPYPNDNTEGKVYIYSWTYDGGLQFIEQTSAGEGEKGDPGDSAYEVAVANGFAGTEEEWLESLKVQGDPGDPGDSAYEVAVANGFAGTEEQWLESLQGTDGIDGEDGQDAVIGDIVVTPTVTQVDASNIVFAELTGAQNINADNVDINFNIPARSEADWTHAGGTANFLLAGSQYDHVIISANITYQGDASGTPIHPIIDLLKNGVVIASASAQHGAVSNGPVQNTINGSATIQFMDTGTLIDGVSYKLRCRQGNDNATSMNGVSGFFSAKAVKRVDVVTEIQLSAPPE